ncbi:MAG: alpha/beta hydrolase [Hydrogenophilales bacterium CG17_big_fil_post_rev_8_21_14_2_50_63_12]|nr:MAG: alpha/beta hydrolase [Hydrogenophilales bacterium CG17_big_fil_post_rev_8_21_14_2_50_63_12]PIX97697.1 MAG: alpha/beta hydrolase [Hydrogenophilales bacterium CG_4_10_14_3_um_filter_63_21]PJB07712.1 MAG: alpha/beta hydrolase [Hydrogenophilales bacterium CG_4_9_14_3_um_filter_63_34]
MKRHKLRIKVPVGYLETVIEEPDGAPRGLALIAHPHPLKGGSLDNKVAWTLARAALACGLIAVRPNFRGVGASSGSFDHGIGETEDLLALAASVAGHYGPLPLTLMGFSFGAYVQHRVARELPAERLILVGAAVSLYEFAANDIPTTLIHGTEDEVIPFAAARDYAHQHAIPLIEIEGAGHFFHGKLRELQNQAESLCRP